MKILLIGHSIIDHFEEFNQSNYKPGGLFYSSLGINSLINSDDEIYLITTLDKKYADLFSPIYNEFDFRLSEYSDSMPEVVLKISGDEERKETYKNVSAKLNLQPVEKLNSFDGILINMITGFDIDSVQLKWLRANFSCPIYFDVHTLSRGLDSSMNRIFRPIPDIENWLRNLDILQCNESELKTIVEKNSLEESAEYILSLGIKILLITRAEKGATVFWQEEGLMKTISLDAGKINVKNKVGCGDIFGAAFFYSYISSMDVKASLTMANRAGALAASIENLTSQTKLVLK